MVAALLVLTAGIALRLVDALAVILVGSVLVGTAIAVGQRVAADAGQARLPAPHRRDDRRVLDGADRRRRAGRGRHRPPAAGHRPRLAVHARAVGAARAGDAGGLGPPRTPSHGAVEPGGGGRGDASRAAARPAGLAGHAVHGPAVAAVLRDVGVDPDDLRRRRAQPRRGRPAALAGRDRGPRVLGDDALAGDAPSQPERARHGDLPVLPRRLRGADPRAGHAPRALDGAARGRAGLEHRPRAAPDHPALAGHRAHRRALGHGPGHRLHPRGRRPLRSGRAPRPHRRVDGPARGDGRARGADRPHGHRRRPRPARAHCPEPRHSITAASPSSARASPKRHARSGSRAEPCAAPAAVPTRVARG